jgi:putative membrane fusion protein
MSQLSKEQITKEIDDLKSDIDQYKHDIGSSNVKKAHVARQDFINSISRLKTLTIQSEHADALAEKRRTELKSHRDSMWAARDQSQFRYKAAISGLVSYRTDGLEGALSLKGKKEDLARVIEDICDGSRSYEKYVMSDGVKKSVKAGEAVARVVDNFKTFVAIEMPKTQNELVEGKRVRIRFDSLPDETFIATHYQTLPISKESQVLAIFQLDEYTEAFTYLRLDKTEVITSQSEGIIVPNSSIIEKDGYKGVYLAKRGFPIFQRVDIVGEGHGECVVSGIPKDVKVIRNPKVVDQV